MAARLRSLIRQAYRILDDATPIPADCGKLCGSACCKGDDEVGMLLFPGEAAMLAGVPGFKVHRVDYMSTKQWLLTCDGDCDRDVRPLNCRIFPLGPKVREGGVFARLDVRARMLGCPLVTAEYLDPLFSMRVNRVLRLLSDDKRMLAFMSAVSGEIDELERFHKY